MIHDELQEPFHHGLTKQEVIDRIIEFEIDNDLIPDLRETLEYGFIGYHYMDENVLREIYDEYLVDEEYEGDPDYVPNDYVSLDGHGDQIPNE